MSRFLKALHSGRVLLMDGAMGTELQRAGLGDGECGEAWNLTHPERVKAIHRSYIYAGARCLLTNTFQSNPLALEAHHLEGRLEEINREAVNLARSVMGVNHFLLASVGPLLTRHGPSAKRVVRSLRGVDAFLLETWPDLNPQFRQFYWHSRKPVLLSFTYRRGLLPGVPPCTSVRAYTPDVMARGAEIYADRIAALGVNCGRDMGIDEILKVVRLYRSATGLPIFVRPNAGTPTRVGDRWVYPQTPAAMAARLPELLEAGVCMVGGCCGTTPEHIAAFRKVIDTWNAR